MLRDNACGGKCLSFAQPETGMQVIITCLLLVMKHRIAVASSTFPHRTQSLHPNSLREPSKNWDFAPG